MSATTTSAGQRTKSPTRHAHKHEDPPDFSCKELAVFMNCMTASQFNEIRTFFQSNCGRPDDWVRFLKNTDMTLDDSKDRTSPGYAKQLLLFVRRHLLIPDRDLHSHYRSNTEDRP